MPVGSKALPCLSCLGPALQVCVLCRIARYCSEECHRKHWPAHRVQCFHTCGPPGVMDARADDPAAQLLNGFSEMALAVNPPAPRSETRATAPVALSQSALPIETVSPRQQPMSSQQANQQAGAEPRDWDRFERLSETEFTKVLVTCTNFEELWANKCDNAALIVKLNVDLERAAAAGLPSCVPVVGGCYAGCYEGQWCRVKVVAVAPALMVRYIDYGNQEALSLRDMRSLPAPLLRIPAQAVRIRLAGANQKKYERFKVDSEMSVKLLAEAVDGAMEVVIEGDDPVAPRNIAAQELPAHEFAQVVVVETGPDSLVVNLVSQGNAMTDMAQRLERAVKGLPPVTAPAPGDLVAAEFVDDGGSGWYRARVTHAGPPPRVLYVDFGNVAAVPACAMRALPAEFLTLPAQAVKVRLAAGSHPRFGRMPANATFRARAVGKGDGFVVVEPEDLEAARPASSPAHHDTSAPSPAAAEMASAQLPSDRYEAVTVVEAVANGYVVTVDANQQASYELVTKLSRRAPALPKCTQPRVGQLVAAIFCGDWYRARITQLAPLQVYFVDYGNAEDVSLDQVRELPADAMALPAQAVTVAMAPGTTPANLSLPANALLRVKVVARTPHATVVHVEGDPAPTATPTACAAVVSVVEGNRPPPCVEPEQVEAGARQAVFFVFRAVDGGSAGFVQRKDSSALLLSLNAAVQAAAAATPPAPPADGAAVLVLFEGEWARAVVTSARPEIRVRFLDYGNDGVAAPGDVRAMPADLAQIPAQCCRVELSRDTPAAVRQLGDYAPFTATFLAKAADSTWTIRGEIQ